MVKKPDDVAFLDLPDGRIAFRRVWPADARGTPLVFLHEGLGSIAQWRDFPDALCVAARRPGFVYERPGHGASAPIREKRRVDYLHREARLLGDVLDAAGIAACDLLGHSDGGSIALLAGAMNPTRHARIATMAAHVFVEKITREGIEAAVAAWHTTDLPAKLARYHGAGAQALFFAWADIWLSGPFAFWNIEGDIAPCAARVLALQGAADEYGGPEQLARIARALPGRCETWLVPGAAHQPHIQARDAVLAGLAGFFAG
ncbi:MAG: alpha/beta fold hydrolase [Azospirillum sp.]|nr:alpha/beta fold hydrolase [Azospirillum sp.]